MRNRGNGIEGSVERKAKISDANVSPEIISSEKIGRAAFLAPILLLSDQQPKK
jgi:hypothetical protein